MMNVPFIFVGSSFTKRVFTYEDERILHVIWVYARYVAVAANFTVHIVTSEFNCTLPNVVGFRIYVRCLAIM